MWSLRLWSWGSWLNGKIMLDHWVCGILNHFGVEEQDDYEYESVCRCSLQIQSQMICGMIINRSRLLIWGVFFFSELTGSERGRESPTSYHSSSKAPLASAAIAAMLHNPPKPPSAASTVGLEVINCMLLFCLHFCAITAHCCSLCNGWCGTGELACGLL